MTHENKKSEPVGEFDLIRRYFTHIGPPLMGEVLLGVGDDAALIACDPDALVIATDTLVSGVHFYADDPPDSIAHKALAVNVSDLAAMGAIPFAFLLSLTLPESNSHWLQIFSDTLNEQALKANMALVGGDTTRGPLTVSITALGRVNRRHALTRSAAKPQDDIYVTGEIGLAAFYVYAKKHGLTASERAMQAYRYPKAMFTLGHRLCGLAHAAIDVSDGLFADLSHILDASQVGAQLIRDRIPIAHEWNVLPPDQAFEAAVTGGDDYALCFTAPKSAAGLIALLAESAGITFASIGEICEGSGILLDGKPLPNITLGFQHF
jgi:thiamine-monophosphate kinase